MAPTSPGEPSRSPATPSSPTRAGSEEEPGTMTDGVEMQRQRADRVHGDLTEGLWDHHYTSDPLIRYLRDRRLHRALKELDERGRLDVANQSVLLVCGGVGGEGTFL